MEKEKFKKSKKWIIELFTVYFWGSIIDIIFKVLYFMMDIDAGKSLKSYILRFTALCIYYIVLKLAKKNAKIVGFIGMAYGVFEILLGGWFWKLIGALLLFNSIRYLVHYKEAE